MGQINVKPKPSQAKPGQAMIYWAHTVEKRLGSAPDPSKLHRHNHGEGNVICETAERDTTRPSPRMKPSTGRILLIINVMFAEGYLDTASNFTILTIRIQFGKEIRILALKYHH